MSGAPVTVVRLGHRQQRDKRITSHLGLTARALGADHFVLCGDEDEHVMETVSGVTERFGGSFTAAHEARPMAWLKAFKREGGAVIHLTMYGETLNQAISSIPSDTPLAVVVGGAKVPGEMYTLADHNIAVGNQPHSEVAALALFLHELFGEIPGPDRFEGGKLEIQPSAQGKVVIEKE